MPRPTLHADDLVTPTQFGRIVGVNGSTVRTWIDRHKIPSLGRKGRWNAYDYNDLAAVEALHRAEREAA